MNHVPALTYLQIPCYLDADLTELPESNISAGAIKRVIELYNSSTAYNSDEQQSQLPKTRLCERTCSSPDSELGVSLNSDKEEEITKKTIKEGAVILKGILDDSLEELTPDQLKKLFLCFWLSKDPFENGSFKILDEDKKLFNILSKMDGIYARSSSHYPEYGSGLLNHKGIDIDNIVNNKFHHLLFCSLDIDGCAWLFLKPEPYGTSWSHLLGHAVHFYGAMYTRVFDPAANELKGLRKEHLPNNVKTAFITLMNKAISSFPGSASELTEAKNKGLNFGIFKIKVAVDLISDLINRAQKDGLLSDENSNLLMKDLTIVINHMAGHMDNNDDALVRKGNEVVFHKEDLKKLVMGQMCAFR